MANEFSYTNDLKRLTGIADHQKEYIKSLIAGQESLQKFIAEQKAEIEQKDVVIKGLEKALENVTIEADRLLKECESKEKAYTDEYILRKELKAENKRLRFRKCLYSGLYSDYDIKLIRDCTQEECFHRESEEAVRIEAIKEFAERLTDKADLMTVNVYDSKWVISQEDIDNLVKEMVGESDA